MKVIGICGSPREKSNTHYFLNYTLEELEKRDISTELIRLRDKKISHCTGCYKCLEAKECVIQDDMKEIMDKVIQADGLLLGTPVYHGSMTPLLKSLLDRMGFSGRWMKSEIGENYGKWQGTPFSGKIGAPITVARRAGFTSAFEQILLWLSVNDFIIMGSNYWNVGIAGKAGSVNANEDEEGLANFEYLANNMANLLKKIK